MTTITIPKNLIKEKDLILVPRLQYENLLKHSVVNENYESLWNKAIKNKFFKSYSKSDEIYDQI
ncbi:MAG: hypothetical protein AAB453_02650 [Patescibacteria group bacterium]